MQAQKLKNQKAKPVQTFVVPVVERTKLRAVAAVDAVEPVQTRKPKSKKAKSVPAAVAPVVERAQFRALAVVEAVEPVVSDEDDHLLNGYELACVALVTLKGVNVFDLVYDDRIISKLCLLTRGVTRKLIKKHLELELGRPTEETIDRVLMELENENVFGAGTDSI